MITLYKLTVSVVHETSSLRGYGVSDEDHHVECISQKMTNIGLLPAEFVVIKHFYLARPRVWLLT